jgi:hypothetical protein
MNSVKIQIGSKEVQVSSYDDLPISIDYSLEEVENFQVKDSANSLGLKIPATLMNQKASNAFHGVDSTDLTPGESFKSNQPCYIQENGLEIFTGKAFLVDGSHTVTPTEYQYNLYGDNANWIIDLKEKTIYDFVKQISLVFTKATMETSWSFDGTDEALPYVFAPIRYRFPFGGYNIQTINGVQQNVAVDDNVSWDYLKPSISVYWILYWGFKSIGYRIKSDFLDTEYFRRLIMPWTWGNFLDSDGTKINIHRFAAKSTEAVHYRNTSGNNQTIMDLKVSNDKNGAFDNNNEYDYVAPDMKWTYNTPYFGPLKAHFTINIQSEVDMNAHASGTPADIEVRVQWFKNGVMFDGGSGQYNPPSLPSGALYGNLLFKVSTSTTQWHKQYFGLDELVCQVDVDNTDVITARVAVYSYANKKNKAVVDAHFTVFNISLDYFKIASGSTIPFDNYTAFQNYKFLDFFRGVIDLFNLSVNTDPSTRSVIIEPTHQYYLQSDPTDINPGYFKDDFITWDGKEDLSKVWTMQNFSELEREFYFKFKDDTSDGILKTIQDRYVIKLAQGKYVLPERFKQGKKEFENRFFSPLMHYDVDEWKAYGTGSNAGISPQVICIIPENVSNTSQGESSNTFLPKIAYYKGYISGVGAWKWDGDILQDLPYMFAVNYKAGGEDDPVLSYSDELIKNVSGDVVAKGLLTRFFLQRLAIMRNGQWYNGWFRLKNGDVANQLHREYKSYKGHRWELVQIKSYKPLSMESTACLVRRFEPVSQIDADNVFPSQNNILSNSGTSSFDLKYSPLKGLIKDIPK